MDAIKEETVESYSSSELLISVLLSLLLILLGIAGITTNMDPRDYLSLPVRLFQRKTTTTSGTSVTVGGDLSPDSQDNDHQSQITNDNGDTHQRNNPEHHPKQEDSNPDSEETPGQTSCDEITPGDSSHNHRCEESSNQDNVGDEFSDEEEACATDTSAKVYHLHAYETTSQTHETTTVRFRESRSGSISEEMVHQTTTTVTQRMVYRSSEICDARRARREANNRWFEGLLFGSDRKQGDRKHMEDRDQVFATFDRLISQEMPESFDFDSIQDRIDLGKMMALTVIDGHAGSAAADFVEKNLAANIAKSMAHKLSEKSSPFAKEIAAFDRSNGGNQKVIALLRPLVDTVVISSSSSRSSSSSSSSSGSATTTTIRSTDMSEEEARDGVDGDSHLTESLSQCNQGQWIDECILEGFKATEQGWKDEAQLKEDVSGAACAFAVIHDRCLHVANVGDVEAFVCRRKEQSESDEGCAPFEAVRVSSLHSPIKEKARVDRETGESRKDDTRLKGGLSVSRAFGDFAPISECCETEVCDEATPMMTDPIHGDDDCCDSTMTSRQGELSGESDAEQEEGSPSETEKKTKKESSSSSKEVRKMVGLSAVPTIVCHPISDRDEFLLMACDGVWDVNGGSEPDYRGCMGDVRRQLRSQHSEDSCNRACSKLMRDGKCSDNTTAIVVSFSEVPKLKSDVRGCSMLRKRRRLLIH